MKLDLPSLPPSLPLPLSPLPPPSPPGKAPPERQGVPARASGVWLYHIYYFSGFVLLPPVQGRPRQSEEEEDFSVFVLLHPYTARASRPSLYHVISQVSCSSHPSRVGPHERTGCGYTIVLFRFRAPPSPSREGPARAPGRPRQRPRQSSREPLHGTCQEQSLLSPVSPNFFYPTGAIIIGIRLELCPCMWAPGCSRGPFSR